MSIDHLLKQSCTISAKGGQNKVGQTSFGAAVTYSCRFQKTNRTIVTSQSEKEPIDGIVFLPSSASFNLEDKLVFAGTSYRVMRIEPMVDGAGATRHFEAMVQRWNV